MFAMRPSILFALLFVAASATPAEVVFDGSPGIDAGDPTFVGDLTEADPDGFARVYDGDGDGFARVDMGAFEFHSCPGDLDGDGEVGLADLATLLASYGTTSGASYGDGDLAFDGDVDLADLAALLAAYGQHC